MDAFVTFEILVWGCVGFWVLVWILACVGECCGFKNVYELLAYLTARVCKARDQPEPACPYVHDPKCCRKCDSDLAAARERIRYVELPAWEDANAGPPPLVDADAEDEDSDCVVVPRRRQRSRSPYETRSTARRLRVRS